MSIWNLLAIIVLLFEDLSRFIHLAAEQRVALLILDNFIVTVSHHTKLVIGFGIEHVGHGRSLLDIRIIFCLTLLSCIKSLRLIIALSGSQKGRVIYPGFESGYLSQLSRQIFCLITFIPTHHWICWLLLLLLILFLFFIVGSVDLGLKFWKVALYVFLEKLAAEGEIFQHVVIAEHCIQVSDEIFSIEMHKVVVKVHLRQGLDVSVHVQWNVTNCGLIE